MSLAATNRTCRTTPPLHLTMDAYVDVLAASLASVDVVKADRLKRIQKNIRVPFSFASPPKRTVSRQ